MLIGHAAVIPEIGRSDERCGTGDDRSAERRRRSEGKPSEPRRLGAPDEVCAAFGWHGWTDLARVGALVVFGLIMWRIAIHAMTRKLVD